MCIDDYDDNLLFNLEEVSYKEGYEEGRNENLEKNYYEGKQYGLQVGFQRFHNIGQIQSICSLIISMLPKETEPKQTTLVKHCQQVIKTIEQLTLDNSSSSVKIYESEINKIRNKFRTILIIWNKSNKSNKLEYENIVLIDKRISGEIKGYIQDHTETAGTNEKSNEDLLNSDHQTTDW
ncbi:uncharacterized protein SCODWIG_00533 [Saccharomycodes ludwigii]|uniref:Essential protein Yae1 N-terminal domain-containing protein n=1 Tax=Saccharomycodes ludwigii TaxID=36035 RepID=A0A376B2B9_9ASCO|nr:hypothetical protein SCDLUD_003908 [Saccharomycodes ludwigii]KAH3899628.1 hypothetical protein SCDLUD_003908 [Saccharomycodes ludwigii]SSD58772.1 uncharacterized protein SCODWIG_00533 [Saccharomycodes ludwigii]